MEIIQQLIQRLPGKIESSRIKRIPFSLKKYLLIFLNRIKFIGYSESIDDYELQKLSIFNQVNFFQLLTGLFIPFAGLFQNKQFPAGAWVVACLPALVSVLVLYLNKLYKYEAALVSYFILYPFVTCVVFMYGMNLGNDLYFILYGILAVFFLKDTGFMIFSISFSMLSYFILSVVLKKYIYQLENINNVLYLVNQGLAIVFIFYGLYLIKKENSVYQVNILDKNSDLQQKNVQIQTQADEIKENATLLEKQTIELTGLNTLKNKLFSIISHDLKAPMYALRNLFSDIQREKLPPTHLQKIMPEVVKDLNYTVNLMDNLLQWAKAQMQAEVVYPQKVDVGQFLEDAVNLVRLQSESKRIRIEIDKGETVHAIMDKEMLSLVLRNLLSNAIKFTPEKGTITIGVNDMSFSVEIYVMDNGAGISNDAILKIKNNNFYTTKGTANESGTGLGLMLCKEYLIRNGSLLHIESKIGEGSKFSFTLPKAHIKLW